MNPAAPTLLAFDFDGTLAPICHDPSSVRIHRGAAALLHHLTRMRGVAAAIASGRDADDIAERAGVSGAFIIGSHGLEIRAPGGVPVRDSPPLVVPLDDDLRREILANGLRIERKKHAVAVHWRGVRANVAPIAERFRAWAAAHELEVIDGRCVVEGRCRGAGKEEALHWLASSIGASRVIYAGDDITDFAALEFASRRGLGVFVANSERVPPADVMVVNSFRELFHLIREEVMI